VNDTRSETFGLWRNQQIRIKELLFLGPFLLITPVIVQARMWQAFCGPNMHSSSPNPGGMEQHCLGGFDAGGANDARSCLPSPLMQWTPSKAVYSLACGKPMAKLLDWSI
jgi:hypothetical protein